MADPDVGEPFCEWAGNIYIWLSRASLDDLRMYFTENLPGADEGGTKVSASCVTIGATALVALYEAERAEHNAFQPKRPTNQTPLTFVGCFCIEGELAEISALLPNS